MAISLYKKFPLGPSHNLISKVKAQATAFLLIESHTRNGGEILQKEGAADV